jgi:hypothetical protein
MDNMATIAENLQIIKDSTDAIKQAIIDKGGSIDGDISTWAEVINNLSSDKAGSVVKITNKLNGAVLGDADKVYDIEEVLHTYITENAEYAFGFTRHSLGFEGFYNSNAETLLLYLGQQCIEMNYGININKNYGYKITVYNSAGGNYNGSGDPILFYFIAVDNNYNYDIDYFYIQHANVICYAKDTDISLYNGITKKVQNINYNDELLVWNFDEGKFDRAKPLWIKKEEKTNNYYKVTLDNGNTINLVGSNGKCHRLFNYDDMMFESATELVGKNVHTLNGIHKVVSVENVKETVEYYNIITNYHMNCFANGILTSCRFNNLYPIKDMVFDKSNVNVDPRWKIHQEKFKPNPEILPKYIKGMRLDENQTISIEEMKKYITNLELRKKTVMDFEENLEYCSNIEDTEVGWISPEGEVFGYKLYMPGQRTHEIIAKNICKKKNIDSDNYSKTLEQLGFVKYTNTFIACGENVDITERQETRIKKFMNNNKKIKERGTIKINNYIGEDVKVQEL